MTRCLVRIFPGASPPILELRAGKGPIPSCRRLQKHQTQSKPYNTWLKCRKARVIYIQTDHTFRDLGQILTTGCSHHHNTQDWPNNILCRRCRRTCRWVGGKISLMLFQSKMSSQTTQLVRRKHRRLRGWRQLEGHRSCKEDGSRVGAT
jgi:hypothetical protein